MSTQSTLQVPASDQHIKALFIGIQKNRKRLSELGLELGFLKATNCDEAVPVVMEANYQWATAHHRLDLICQLIGLPGEQIDMFPVEAMDNVLASWKQFCQQQMIPQSFKMGFNPVVMGLANPAIAVSMLPDVEAALAEVSQKVEAATALQEGYPDLTDGQVNPYLREIYLHLQGQYAQCIKLNEQNQVFQRCQESDEAAILAARAQIPIALVMRYCMEIGGMLGLPQRFLDRIPIRLNAFVQAMERYRYFVTSAATLENGWIDEYSTADNALVVSKAALESNAVLLAEAEQLIQEAAALAGITSEPQSASLEGTDAALTQALPAAALEEDGLLPDGLAGMFPGAVVLTEDELLAALQQAGEFDTLELPTALSADETGVTHATITDGQVVDKPLIPTEESLAEQQDV